MKKNILRTTWKIIKRAANKYADDDPIRMAGTLGFFTIFAIPPIVIIINSIIGYIIGERAISGELYNQIGALIGTEGKRFIQNLVRNYRNADRSPWGVIFGIIVFVLASTTLFVNIQNSLNFIWRIKPKPKNDILKFLRDRVLSFGVILSLGFILLVSFVFDAGVALIENYLRTTLPTVTYVLVSGLNIVISFILTTLILAIMYKFLPDAKIRWSVTWVGALITSLLFSIGKYIIGFALGNSNLGNMYGQAGSIIIIFLWVFYSGLIMFFGAEITYQYAKIMEKEIRPQAHAVRFEKREISEE